MLVDLMQLFNTVQPIQNCYSMYVDTEMGCASKFIQSHPLWLDYQKNRAYLTHSTYHNTIKVQFEEILRE